jgi:hypothetical protein
MHSLAETQTTTRLTELLEARGFMIANESFAIGRPDRPTIALRTPDGRMAIAKAYPPGGAAPAHDNLCRVWRSSFGSRRLPPGVPEPLMLLEELDLLVTERIDGQPLATSATLERERFDNAIRLVAELHSSDAQPAKRRTSRGILRSLGRKLELVTRAAPQYAEAMRAVIGVLEGARPNDHELVPNHGDCSPRNVLVTADRLVMIDWDRLQLADPARDVAYFGLWNWKQDLRQGRAPRRARLERAVEIYDQCRPVARVRRRLPFHLAAGLVRQSASIVHLWPEDVELVPTLLELAMKELK